MPIKRTATLVHIKMKSFVLAVIALAAVATASHRAPITTLKDLKEPGSRIISGEPAVPGQFPWQVSNEFTVTGGSAFCGGALICNRWVLTAAHCAIDAKSFTITLGAVNRNANEEGTVVVRTTTGIVHENYNSFTLNNDIALVDLGQAVNFTDNIQAIRLGRHETSANLSLTVSGWGKTSDGPVGVSPVLNHVNLTSITNKECADVYGTLVVRNSTICCKGRPEHSTCNGDSGGPLVELTANGWEHVGVVSFVNSAGCASGKPSGYVRTASYIDWIQKQINGTCELA